jgi:ribosomal-protein-alanine N-acetyltransferase
LGRGYATQAVRQFLDKEQCRPLYGRVAHDNFGSQRVLEKAGFRVIGKEKNYANARGREIEEFIYQLA